MITFRRLLGYVRTYRRELWGSLIFAWAAMGMTVLIPWLIGMAVSAIEDGDLDRLWQVVGLILGAAVLRLVLTVVRRIIAGRVSLAVEFDLRQQIYSHLQQLELGFFDQQQTGQLMSRATVDLQAIRFFLGYGLIFFSQSLLTIALAAGVMFWINPWLALVGLAPTPLVVLTAFRFTRQSRPAMQEVQQRVAELTAQAEETVTGIRVVKAFAREDHQYRKFQGAVDRLFEKSLLSTRIQAFFQPLIGALPQIGTALVLLVGGRAVIADQIGLGEFTAFYTYMLMLSSPLRSFGMALGMGQRAIAAGNRLFEVLDRDPGITAPPGAPPLPDGGGRIQFEGVDLNYGSGAGDALSGISLDLAAGSRIGLVGGSGSGKTSLVALIARLYDPTGGRVMIDGADLRSVETGSIRTGIAYVSDDSFLFSDSIRANIAYARPDAGDEEIERAARLAQADRFIEDLSEGYETVVGERGLTLSGGQRQRIAIARAILADPRILILDDATSSLDAATERAVRDGLDEVIRDRTTIVIGHRTSTLSLADEILVMEAGRIVERGSHTELATRSQAYRSLIASDEDQELRFVREPEGAVG
ncbi:MAG: ABC transporter ATP-binding protein/permease [Solirubrobacterales bacterium]|nr:ABC transporter ATP-binding protein/permease [Solirubrobacterales bacterium]